MPSIWPQNSVSATSGTFLRHTSPEIALTSRKKISTGKQRFPNVYARTKYVGESLVRAWAGDDDDRRFTVFRPSILVGREDGTTNAFDTYYGYMYPYDSNAQSVRRRAATGKSLPADISVDADGIVHMPLVAVMSETSTLNLIPTDWCAETIRDLLDVHPQNETYHVVHPFPPRIRTVLDMSLDHLKIRGITTVSSVEAKEAACKGQSSIFSILQGRMDSIHAFYWPYVTAEPRFTMENPQRALGKRFREPIPIDSAFLGRLLALCSPQKLESVQRRRGGYSLTDMRDVLPLP